MTILKVMKNDVPEEIFTLDYKEYIKEIWQLKKKLL